ncbi:helix-turn-helix transcriptional regulator [Pseudodonghicola flavimaris]|uniref:Helix-turn-helix transcriptional regulator n=1 Tax=Pseudodonghicola flavimaris TaxID=3050036 RepID=A0ABT7F3G9_9RHOB|nr:helix-turn-helix transcriptional regulator [Pseudodonghicola flavimaris]MDK3019148.1 helix-turn-helix transcriptional regulator [Pseudodonghicola flavimaris]
MGQSEIRAIDACLGHTGQDGWAAPFLDLVVATGAVQVMVFAYDADHAACLLSRNFRAQALGGALAESYLDGWYRQDPLYARVLALAPGALSVVTGGAPGPEDYRLRFFERPGLAGKTAVLAAGARLRLVLNLYWEVLPRDEDALLPLLGRLALLHFEARLSEAPPALAVLSERERAVCLGMLAGKKAEEIADDLGVAASSVVTYRRRAYDKLGISSRGALFAICRR